MLSRLTAPVANLLRNGSAPSKSVKGVPELLAELAEIRAQKVELERREADIVAATQARLLEEQKALEGLKKKVSDCGIELRFDCGTSPVAMVNGDN